MKGRSEVRLKSMNYFFRSMGLILLMGSLVFGLYQATRYFFPNFMQNPTQISSSDAKSSKSGVKKKAPVTAAERQMKQKALSNLISAGFVAVFALGVFLAFRRR